MSLFTVLWVGWLLTFAVVEATALVLDHQRATKGDTLSEHLRTWFRTDTHLGRNLFAVAWGGFGVWMLLHILQLV